MNSPHHCTLAALLLAAAVCCAQAVGQETETDGESQSTPPQQPADAGQPPSETPLPFPGADLFNGNPPFLTGVTLDRVSGVYREKETFRVQFMAEQEAHLYLIYHQADGQSLLLFPNAAVPGNLIPARQPVQLPPPQGQFRFRVQAPLGREVLQVIASVAPLPEFDALIADATGAPVVSRELLIRVRDLLAAVPAGWTEHRVPLETVPRDEPPPTRPAGRAGLFIGIGEYLHPEFCATHEELRHSAEVMCGLMQQQGGLTPDTTRLLIDRQATRAAMEEHITRWLPSVTQPGDTVFIYFSGHAGQFETSDPSEPDGQDESLAPYDLHAGKDGEPVEQRMVQYRASSILDDTFARWLQELAGRQIVVILDTCHGGGVVEGKSLAANFLDDEAGRVKDIAQLNTIVLTSCAVDEQSQFEGTPNKTMWFTYCLSEAIENPNRPRPLTVQAAFEYSAARMKQLLVQGNAAREQQPTLTDMALLPVVLAP